VSSLMVSDDALPVIGCVLTRGRRVIHVRIVSPSDITADLVDRMTQDAAVFSITLHRGVSRHPDGDLVEFEVLNGAANAVLTDLRMLGLYRRGSIVLEDVAVFLSDEQDQAGARLGRFQQFAPVWEEVEARVRAGAAYPPSWYLLLVIAGVIGAVGILTNSQILVVAAMVVGPEYGAMASMAFCLPRRDWRPIKRGAIALTVGFSAAMLASLLLGMAIRGGGLTPRAYEFGVRPVSNLINTPNVFSVIVATLAAVVGVVSLTEARASTLIGVFVSVTTIPAAADVGLSAAYSDWSEARGSLFQLLLNVSLLVVVGAVAFVVQRRLWDATARRPASHSR
jgi:uncharacterized hydrophobic protein (TIGR00271 family)